MVSLGGKEGFQNEYAEMDLPNGKVYRFGNETFVELLYNDFCLTFERLDHERKSRAIALCYRIGL